MHIEKGTALTPTHAQKHTHTPPFLFFIRFFLSVSRYLSHLPVRKESNLSSWPRRCQTDHTRQGADGDEYLAKNLNSYFELLIRAMSGQGVNTHCQIQIVFQHVIHHTCHLAGGDVFKFAGDAILVVWPPSEEVRTMHHISPRNCISQTQRNRKPAIIMSSASCSCLYGEGQKLSSPKRRANKTYNAHL